MNMSTTWEVLAGNSAPAAVNMQRDKELLASLAKEPRPILHFYEWEGDSATFGHFVRPEKWLNLTALAEMGVALARRPTGGGILFHTVDLAFAVLIPCGHPLYSTDTLTCYQLINARVLAAAATLLDQQPELLAHDPRPLDKASGHFCMAKPTIYDVMLNGRKIGGAAQRRTHWGCLHQGSVALTQPSDSFLQTVLRPDSRVYEAMQAHGYYPLGPRATTQQLTAARAQLRQELKHSFVLS
jgi:lipoate-protein ligase A